MRKQRSLFTAEFKRETANLVLEEGYSVTEACNAMGVGETALRRWIAQLVEEQNGKPPKGKALTPEQQRIQELEKRIKRLELEKDILTKATALLMSDEMRNMR